MKVQSVDHEDWGSYIHIQIATEGPLYVLSHDIVQNFSEHDGWLKQIPTLAAYTLPEERFSQGLYFTFDMLIPLDPQLQDRRHWDLSPPPPDVKIPLPDHSSLFIVFEEELYEIPFEIVYHVNENFNADDCSYWWSSMEATEQARYEATQVAVEAAVVERRSFYGPVLIFLLIVVVLIWVISSQRQHDN